MLDASYGGASHRRTRWCQSSKWGRAADHGISRRWAEGGPALGNPFRRRDLRGNPIPRTMPASRLAMCVARCSHQERRPAVDPSLSLLT